MAAGSTAKVVFRLVRFAWRYHAQVEAHTKSYATELATAIRTTLDSTVIGRVALTSYRVSMRLLLAIALLLVFIALLVLFALHEGGLDGLWLLIALVPLVPALWCVFQWATLGAALRWLDEYADPSRTVTIDELPDRLRALAAETRHLADIPARMADDLEAAGRSIEELQPRSST